MKIIVCPKEEKKRILYSFSMENKFSPIKFMTKDEFISQYYFSYNEKAYYYLMNKYGFNIDVCKIYLKYLYVIDENKNYKSKKLQFLRDLKLDLINNNYLVFSSDFSDYLENVELEVKGYYNLDLYEEIALSYSFDFPLANIDNSVYEFSTMEEEVNFVCIKVLELLKKGISPSKIFLCNVSNEYFYTIKKIFSYYKIPINIPFKDSIYSNSIVQNYLKTGNLDISINNPVISKLVSIINSLTFLDLSDEISHEILIDKIKHTYYSVPIIEPAVSICNLEDREFEDDEYVFVLGFNQDVFPKLKKDIDFISDSEKIEIPVFTTIDFNKREKQLGCYLLSRISNLFLSYKLSTPFASYYRSSLIDELGLPVIKGCSDTYQFSNFYNKLRLGEELDLFYLYGEESDKLRLLNANYDIPYLTYSNQYSGISRDLYLTNLDYPLNLSYTSINTYNECSFKYYLKYVLRLDVFEDTFSSFIGSLYHKILSLCYYPDFNFEEAYQAYLEKRNLTFREKLFLVRIKKDLLKLIEILKKQQLITGYDEAFYEKKIEIPVRDDILVNFVGYIDKIMYYKNVEDTYFSIVDYKTGNIDTHIEPMKYGLHMQLPVYLYLMHYGRVFSNPIFTGIYYQNILFDYPKWDKSELDESKRYYLNGYSTDEVSVLEKFDSTYEDSNYIKNMKYDSEKGFSRYSMIFSNDDLYNMIKYTKNKIFENTQDILDANFLINPKIYDKKNISCEFCPFQDICFYTDSDYRYLDKVDDLSFLGGEE